MIIGGGLSACGRLCWLGAIATTLVVDLKIEEHSQRRVTYLAVAHSV
jgi:hypothetical protein